MTHQTLSLEKYWKLFPATLSRDKTALQTRTLSLLLFSVHGKLFFPYQQLIVL